MKRSGAGAKERWRTGLGVPGTLYLLPASMPGLPSEREGHPLCSSSSSAPRSTLPGPDPAVRGRAAAALHSNRAKVSWLRDPRQLSGAHVCTSVVTKWSPGVESHQGTRRAEGPFPPHFLGFPPPADLTPQTGGGTGMQLCSTWVIRPRPLCLMVRQECGAHQPWGPQPGVQGPRVKGRIGRKGQSKGLAFLSTGHVLGSPRASSHSPPPLASGLARVPVLQATKGGATGHREPGVQPPMSSPLTNRC